MSPQGIEKDFRGKKTFEWIPKSYRQMKTKQKKLLVSVNNKSKGKIGKPRLSFGNDWLSYKNV